MVDVHGIEFSENQTAALTAGLLAAAKGTTKVEQATVIDVIDLLSDEEDLNDATKNIAPIKQLCKEEESEYGGEYIGRTVLPVQTLEADEEDCRSNCSSPLQFLEVMDCEFSVRNELNAIVSPVSNEDTMPFPETDNEVTDNTQIDMNTTANVAGSYTAIVTNVEMIPAPYMPPNGVEIHVPILIKTEALDVVKTEPMDFATENDRRDFNANGLCVDDIIDLDDNSDDEVDNDTKAAIVHLIESDNDEANNDANATNNNDPKTMLCHYMCPECNVFCGSSKKWKAHTDIIHKFQAIENLNLRTIVSKDGDLRHQCKDCNRKFKLNGGILKFIRHRITHLPHKNYLKCRLCPLRFTNARSLNIHLNRDHEKIFKHYRKQTETNSFLNFLCPLCRELFNSRSTLVKHLNLMHDYKDLRYKELYVSCENNVYACKLCKKDISNKYVLNHTLLHEANDTFQCKICREYSGKTASDCLQHVNEIHHVIPKRSSKCPYCDKDFKNSGILWDHLQTIHGATVVECKICNKTFRSSRTLWSHVQKSNHFQLK